MWFGRCWQAKQRAGGNIGETERCDFLFGLRSKSGPDSESGPQSKTFREFLRPAYGNLTCGRSSPRESDKQAQKRQTRAKQ
jgi:hypothetical protein